MTTEDVLECVGVLARHLALHSERRHVALGYSPPMRFALKLLHVWDKRTGGRDTWSLPGRWEDRLERVGVDPDTFEIIDQARWNIAWDQWHRTKTFKMDEHNIAIARETIAPLATPIVEERWATPKQKTAPKPRSYEEEPAEDESPYTTVLRRSIKKALNR